MEAIDVDDEKVISPDMSLYCDEDDQYDDYYEESKQFAGKRPRRFLDLVDQAEEELAAYPDLHAYFSQFDIKPKDVIIMCRSYASYVASQNKSTRK